ncbi:MAG: Thioredoxin, partial [uncultured Arthrobacter sp.]
GNYRHHRGKLPRDHREQRHRVRGLLGRLVRPVHPVRSRLRRRLQGARGRRLRQGRHRGRAVPRRRRRDHLDPDPDGVPRERARLLPARRTELLAVLRACRRRQGPGHEGRPRAGRPAAGRRAERQL